MEKGHAAWRGRLTLYRDSQSQPDLMTGTSTQSRRISRPHTANIQGSRRLLSAKSRPVSANSQMDRESHRAARIGSTCSDKPHHR